jgi:ribosomal protein S18 acetylase RimI-like enzyme
MVDVRKATAAEVSTLTRTLGRAFQDDPAFAWAMPNAQRRARFLPRYFELELARTYLPKGEVYLTEDGTAAALWAPPDKWQTPMLATLPFLPVMIRACRTNLPVALTMLASMETRHKKQTEPHYYLPYIGTDPDHQGKGLGAALLMDMVRRCDEEGVPAYLESTAPRNQSLYQRHGFQVLEELHWPKGGPPWWPMWREPQAA